ncbi:basic salivary proline-rich protein 1-like [Canis lupus familiaris]|uniref:basic salivary proline-rich protein 1-like n=1 Tax=Canis lupus familiaris TaxID=9615 RepID=UPI0018F735EA|nr:basic salivary proline-rich protein 1-like [Canis lupus familiaris]
MSALSAAHAAAPRTDGPAAARSLPPAPRPAPGDRPLLGLLSLPLGVRWTPAAGATLGPVGGRVRRPRSLGTVFSGGLFSEGAGTRVPPPKGAGIGVPPPERSGSGGPSTKGQESGSLPPRDQESGSLHQGIRSWGPSPKGQESGSLPQGTGVGVPPPRDRSRGPSPRGSRNRPPEAAGIALHVHRGALAPTARPPWRRGAPAGGRARRRRRRRSRGAPPGAGWGARRQGDTRCLGSALTRPPAPAAPPHWPLARRLLLPVRPREPPRRLCRGTWHWGSLPPCVGRGQGGARGTGSSGRCSPLTRAPVEPPAGSPAPQGCTRARAAGGWPSDPPAPPPRAWVLVAAPGSEAAPRCSRGGVGAAGRLRCAGSPGGALLCCPSRRAPLHSGLAQGGAGELPEGVRPVVAWRDSAMGHVQFHSVVVR